MPDPVGGVADGMEHAPETVGKGLGHKLGPLPVWGWVLLAGGSGLAVYFLFFRNTGDPAADNQVGTWWPSTGTGTGGGSSGGGGAGDGGGSGGTGGGTTGPVRGNLDWLNDAIPAVAKALGMDTARVRLYLEQYLAGRRPVGSPGAINDFDRVVQAALQALGAAPNAPQITNPNQNPYESNLAWLQNALGFLPASMSGARQELIDLVNGRTDTISPEAQQALDYLRAILGYEPNPLSFGQRPPASGGTPFPGTPSPSTPTPAVPTPTPTPNPAPAPTTPTAPDRTSGWGAAIEAAFRTFWGRSATDQEIWDWAEKMKGGVSDVGAAIRQARIDASQKASQNDTSTGWGQTIEGAMLRIWNRHATDQEIWDVAGKMKSGQLGNVGAIEDYIRRTFPRN